MLYIKETKDVNEIKKVLCHRDIYNCIADDNCPDSSEFEPPMDAQYIAGYVDSDIIGLMIYHKVTGGLKCHIQVLPEFRKKYAREFARIALGEAKNAIIYSEIPTCYPNVISFAKEFGFTETGIIKDSYPKNGVNYDVIEMRRVAPSDSSGKHSMI